MVYGELQGKALEWAAKFVFGLDATSMPSQIVISPFEFEKYCGEFRNLVTDRGLKLEKTATVSWFGKEASMFSSAQEESAHRILQIPATFYATAKMWKR